jgi:hypothetical protein
MVSQVKGRPMSEDEERKYSECFTRIENLINEVIDGGNEKKDDSVKCRTNKKNKRYHKKN